MDIPAYAMAGEYGLLNDQHFTEYVAHRYNKKAPRNWGLWACMLFGSCAYEAQKD
jgi:hypothetical protein